MEPNFRFVRQLRLLTPYDFKTVFNQVEFKTGNRHILILARPNQLMSLRCGVIVSKKNVKHAVQRNRIKRQIREVVRLNQHSLPAWDVIFLIKRGADQLDNRTLARQLIGLCKRLQQHAGQADDVR